MKIVGIVLAAISLVCVGLHINSIANYDVNTGRRVAKKGA